jgi:hypothetical protein
MSCAIGGPGPGAIGDEAAGFWKLREQGNEGEPFGHRKLGELLRSVEREGGLQHDTSLNAPCCSGFQSTRDVIRGTYFDSFRLDRQRLGRRFRRRKLQLSERAGEQSL